MPNIFRRVLLASGTLLQRGVDRLLTHQMQAAGLMSIRQHTFFTRSLGGNSTIVDLGAHLGQFSSELHRLYGCRSVAVEPAPDLFAKIPETPGVVRVNAAITERTGPVRLHCADNPEGNTLDPVLARLHNTRRSVEVRGITFDDLQSEHGIERIDILKVDIEGAEIGLLQSMPRETLDRIEQITTEFHDFIPGYDARTAIDQILRRLRDAGFLVLSMSRPYGNHLDVLALHEQRLGLGPLARVRLRLLLRGTVALRTALERMKRFVRPRAADR